MIELVENDDKYENRSNKSNIQLNSYADHSSLFVVLNKLNIPISCLEDNRIRQHYLEEYYTKYTKAKHLLSNARKKQRKIIMTYYNEKEKQNDVDELQTVKQSLLEENQKIKKFKEALKDKLSIYQQRIQFLKDADFWSESDINQIQNSITESTQTTYTDNCADLPTIHDSLHLLHSKTETIISQTISKTPFLDHGQMIYSDNLIDDSCPTITDDNKSDLQYTDVDHSNLYQIPLNHRRQQQKSQTNIDKNLDNLIKKKPKHRFSWLRNIFQLIFLLPSNEQYHRLKFIGSILMITLTILLVIFMNDLIEYLSIYFTKPLTSNSKLSSSKSLFETFFIDIFSTIHQYTTSWLLPFYRLF